LRGLGISSALEENNPMKKTFIALAAIATIAVAAVSAPTPAAARNNTGLAIGAGILGAAIVGGAIANSAPAYAYPRAYYPAAGYEPYPVYSQPAAYGCPGGYWARRPQRDQWGNVVGWSRPRFFCPR
jgi:hypothetical protein